MSQVLAQFEQSRIQLARLNQFLVRRLTSRYTDENIYIHQNIL